MLLKTGSIKEYPDIIKNIKRNFSIDFDISQIPDYYESDSRKSKGEKSIWQRRYFEHTIINEDDVNKHIDYIHYNPMKHYFSRNVGQVCTTDQPTLIYFYIWCKNLHN